MVKSEPGRLNPAEGESMNNADYLERVAAEMIRRPRYCDERILEMIYNEIFRLRNTFRRGQL